MKTLKSVTAARQTKTMPTDSLRTADEVSKNSVTEEFITPERLADPVPTRPKYSDRLTFSPRTWAKIVFMMNRGKTEVSGFGISHPQDLLYVTDFKLVRQFGRPAFTEMLDPDLAAYVEDMCKAGIPPARCLRVWIHTHPGMSCSPSGHDEKTFERMTEMSDWGIMCVIADNDSSARLIVRSSGLASRTQLKTTISLNSVFEGVTEEDYKAWDNEYCECVIPIASVFQESLGAGLETNYYKAADTYDSWRDPVNRHCRAEDWADFVTSYPDVAGETVLDIEVGADWSCYVYTDNYWFKYDDDAVLDCDVGHILQGLFDINSDPPMEGGKLVWNGEEPVLFEGFGDQELGSDQISFDMSTIDDLKDDDPPVETSTERKESDDGDGQYVESD